MHMGYQLLTSQSQCCRIIFFFLGDTTWLRSLTILITFVEITCIPYQTTFVRFWSVAASQPDSVFHSFPSPHTEPAFDPHWSVQ